MDTSDMTLVPVSDVERWGALTGAALLFAYGVSRRSVPGVCVATMAMPLAYRGVVGRWPTSVLSLLRAGDDTRVALAGDRGVQVFEAVRLERPLGEIYAFWRTLGNLPRFMSHLESVTESSDGRSRWVAKGPAGLRVEWQAEIIHEVPNQVIGWRSLPGSDVVTAGSVNFGRVRGGRSTQVSVRLQYAAPAGHVGAVVAGVLGHDPAQTIREDLRRLKQVLEGGEVPRADATIRGGTR